MFVSVLSLSDEPQHEGEGEVIEVKMNKGVTGLGFVIQGGKASPKGDQPISVKRIFKGNIDQIDLPSNLPVKVDTRANFDITLLFVV